MELKKNIESAEMHQLNAFGTSLDKALHFVAMMMNSSNRGNFLELLKNAEGINSVVLNNAPKNQKMTSHDIQKDIVYCATSETTKAIISDLGNDFFIVLLDESRDVSIKEQMIMLIRYIDKKGSVIERFLGMVHVAETSASSLKVALESLFTSHELSISRLRRQGYDKASNMKGEFNGLKSLIMKENPSVFYVHYLAIQLQLALVAVAKNHSQVANIFNTLTILVNVVGASCRRKDLLRERQASKVLEELKKGELSSGRGLNQETSLQRPGGTRWGSHSGTVVNLIIMLSYFIDVLEVIEEDGSNSEQRGEAMALLESIQSFEFLFNLHLMKNVFGITNDLSQALQIKDQDIVNALRLVDIAKKRLQKIKDEIPY